MEKGVATLIQSTRDRFDHILVCLTEAGASVRLLPSETEIIELRKKPGNSAAFVYKLARLLRGLRPSVVHTRNWPGLDGVLAARIAGLVRLVHSEHGLGSDDPNGLNPRRLAVRRLLRGFPQEYVCVSRTLLVIAGEGPERKRLSAVAAATGISERVRLAGAVPHDFLPNYFRAADVLAISSHSEGWPTVIHEAFSCGTPVAANAVGGIPEALGESGLGVLVDGNSPETLARGIAAALATQWDSNVISRHAGLYSWTRIANRYVALFENVIEGWAPAKHVVG